MKGSVTEPLEQLLADGRRNRLLRQAAQRVDGLLHLPEVDAASEAQPQMQVKANPFPEGHAAFQIIGDDLDELLTGHATGQVVQDLNLDVFTSQAGLTPPSRYFSSVLRTRDRARWSRTR